MIELLCKGNKKVQASLRKHAALTTPPWKGPTGRTGSP